MATTETTSQKRAVLTEHTWNKIVGAHAAIGHLIDQWDWSWEPHQVLGQLNAIEACLNRAESSLPEPEEMPHD